MFYLPLCVNVHFTWPSVWLCVCVCVYVGACAPVNVWRHCVLLQRTFWCKCCRLQGEVELMPNLFYVNCRYQFGNSWKIPIKHITGTAIYFCRSQSYGAGDSSPHPHPLVGSTEPNWPDWDQIREPKTGVRCFSAVFLRFPWPTARREMTASVVGIWEWTQAKENHPIFNSMMAYTCTLYLIYNVCSKLM